MQFGSYKSNCCYQVDKYSTGVWTLTMLMRVVGWWETVGTGVLGGAVAYWFACPCSSQLGTLVHVLLTWMPEQFRHAYHLWYLFDRWCLVPFWLCLFILTLVMLQYTGFFGLFVFTWKPFLCCLSFAWYRMPRFYPILYFTLLHRI